MMNKRQRKKLSHRAWVKLNSEQEEQLTPLEKQLIHEDIARGIYAMKKVLENIGPAIVACAVTLTEAIKRLNTNK